MMNKNFLKPFFRIKTMSNLPSFNQTYKITKNSFINFSKMLYCSTSSSIHPSEDLKEVKVPILESLTKTIAECDLTAEKLLLKLEDLIPLPDTFAVVHIGGKQVF